MTIIASMLAHTYKEGQDVIGWWASEKLDGVRAKWTGTEFLSRNDKPLNAPEWFKAQMPKVELDGELYLGRGRFQQTISIVRTKNPDDTDWSEIKYCVFDAPNHGGKFEERLAYMIGVTAGVPVIQLVEQWAVMSEEQLKEKFLEFCKEGAEGIILRKPFSYYEGKRSNNLLKYKPYFDSEAVVTGHQAGLGKHVGRLGALVCLWADGTVFQVGTGFTDEQRENPPQIGQTITFQYQGTTDAGVPRFPVYLCVRDYE